MATSFILFPPLRRRMRRTAHALSVANRLIYNSIERSGKYIVALRLNESGFSSPTSTRETQNHPSFVLFESLLPGGASEGRCAHDEGRLQGNVPWIARGFAFESV